MLQYPVAMEIVALAFAGIFTDFELCADAKFSVWSCILSMTHFIWLWSRRKCIHSTAWTENSFAMYFHLQRKQIPHTWAEFSLTEIAPASIFVWRWKNTFFLWLMCIIYMYIVILQKNISELLLCKSVILVCLLHPFLSLDHFLLLHSSV